MKFQATNIMKDSTCYMAYQSSKSEGTFSGYFQVMMQYTPNKMCYHRLLLYICNTCVYHRYCFIYWFQAGDNQCLSWFILETKPKSIINAFSIIVVQLKQISNCKVGMEQAMDLFSISLYTVAMWRRIRSKKTSDKEIGSSFSQGIIFLTPRIFIYILFRWFRTWSIYMVTQISFMERLWGESPGYEEQDAMRPKVLSSFTLEFMLKPASQRWLKTTEISKEKHASQ